MKFYLKDFFTNCMRNIYNNSKPFLDDHNSILLNKWQPNVHDSKETDTHDLIIIVIYYKMTKRLWYTPYLFEKLLRCYN